MTLSDDAIVRYARHIVLKEIGGEGQRRFGSAQVVVIGAGGIGSPAIQYLAAAGIGRLTIVDDDGVDLSNLQRQTIYTTDDIGRPKAEAAGAAAVRLNPHVAVAVERLRLDATNVRRVIGTSDAVLDGCDNFATRLIVADAANAMRVPLVSAAIGQFDGQLGVFRGWEPDKPCYRCFVGDDPERAGTTCSEDGVLGPMAGAIGSLAALEVLRAIYPFGDDSAGKLLLADTLQLRFRTLALPKDPACATCRPAAL